MPVVLGQHTAADPFVHTMSTKMAATTLKAVAQRCDFDVTCDLEECRIQQQVTTRHYVSAMKHLSSGKMAGEHPSICNWVDTLLIWSGDCDSKCRVHVAEAEHKKHTRLVNEYKKKNAIAVPD